MSREVTIRFFETRHEREPRGRFFVALGELYRLEGRFSEAMGLLEAGIAQCPDTLSARVVRARCLTDLGRDQEARTAWSEVLSADPGHAEARRAIASPQVAAAPAKETVSAAEPAVPASAPADAEHTNTAALPTSPSASAAAGPAPREDAAPETGPAPAPTPVEAVKPTGAPSEPPRPPARDSEPDSGTVPVPPLFQTRTLADIYLGQGHRQKAISILRRILEVHPERTDIAAEIETLKSGGTADVPPSSSSAVAEASLDRDRFDAWVQRTTGRSGP